MVISFWLSTNGCSLYTEVSLSTCKYLQQMLEWNKLSTHELIYSLWTQKLPGWRMHFALGELHQLAARRETLAFSSGAVADVQSQSYKDDGNEAATSH